MERVHESYPGKPRKRLVDAAVVQPVRVRTHVTLGVLVGVSHLFGDGRLVGRQQ